MDTYFETGVNKLKMNNQSGTSCKLECYYKINKDDSPKRVGQTGGFPVGQSKTLDLAKLNIPANAWVTAYANVAIVDDSYGDCWFRYIHDKETTAEFMLSGAWDSTKVTYKGLSEQYVDEGINLMILNNQSGTVCKLECYYKVNKDDTPKRIGVTDKIPLGKSKMLDLTALEIPANAWVTAFANIDAGFDCNATIWFKCQKERSYAAEFTIIGAVGYTVISLNQVGPCTGRLEGYRIAMAAPVQFLDHTYVHAKKDDYFKAYGCHGRDKGGEIICSGTGNLMESDKIAGDDGEAGISYRITGVCHQIANRILSPAGITVYKAHGYSLSCFFYGEYGIGWFSQLETMVDPVADSYFNKVREINLRYNRMEQTSETFANKSVEEFILLAEMRIGKANCLDANALKGIIQYKCKEMELLQAKLVHNEISEQIYCEELNNLGYAVSDKMADIMSDEDFKALFDYEKGFRMALVDVTHI